MEIDFDRIKLTFLLDNCPILHNNPIDCPLYSIRGNCVADKQKWLESLSDEEISEILHQHGYCYMKKSSQN
jgi:hypothetical protein